MRTPFVILALVGLSLALPAPAALAASPKKTSTAHQKCAALDGDKITVTGTALGPTYNAGRNETTFMVVKGDTPCDAIDVVVKGQLVCGGDKRVRVEGKLYYDDNKIVSASLQDASAECALPPSEAPATAAVPTAPAAPAAPAAQPMVIGPQGPAGLAAPKAATETPDFYKLP